MLRLSVKGTRVLVARTEPRYRSAATRMCLVRQSQGITLGIRRDCFFPVLRGHGHIGERNLGYGCRYGMSR